MALKATLFGVASGAPICRRTATGVLATPVGIVRIGTKPAPATATYPAEVRGANLIAKANGPDDIGGGIKVTRLAIDAEGQVEQGVKVERPVSPNKEEEEGAMAEGKYNEGEEGFKPQEEGSKPQEEGSKPQEEGSKSQAEKEENDWPVLKVSQFQDVGCGAAFTKRSLKKEGRALLVCRSPEAMFQTVRILRCARSMMIEEDQHVPIFQPALLKVTRKGGPFTAGSTMLYTYKVLKGNFDVPDVLRVSKNSSPSKLAGAISARIKQHGACTIESFGKVPAAITIQAIAIARRFLVPERLDVGVIIDPVVVEVNAGDIATTMMNRFVLLECEVRNPRKLRVKMETRVGTSVAKL